MTNFTPLVSVIMPTYNDLNSISYAIDSILKQSISNWELIIVDDASTDGTGEFVRENFRDDRIRLYTMTQNRGSGECRNYAIGKSRGEFVAVMDADDESLPTRLEKQACVLVSNPDIDVVASQVEEFGDWGGPLPGQWPTEGSAIAERQVAKKMPVAHPTVMFRRDILINTGGYDTACRRAQDYSLFLKLSTRRIECLDEPLVRYRTQRPVSIKYAVRNQAYADLALRRYLGRLSGNADSELPTEPRYDARTCVLGLRGWLIRTAREYLQLFKSLKLIWR